MTHSTPFGWLAHEVAEGAPRTDSGRIRLVAMLEAAEAVAMALAAIVEEIDSLQPEVREIPLWNDLLGDAEDAMEYVEDTFNHSSPTHKTVCGITGIETLVNNVVVDCANCNRIHEAGRAPGLYYSVRIGSGKRIHARPLNQQ